MRPSKCPSLPGRHFKPSGLLVPPFNCASIIKVKISKLFFFCLLASIPAVACASGGPPSDLHQLVARMRDSGDRATVSDRLGYVRELKKTGAKEALPVLLLARA